MLFGVITCVGCVLTTCWLRWNRNRHVVTARNVIELSPAVGKVSKFQSFYLNTKELLVVHCNFYNFDLMACQWKSLRSPAML
jgi:hypothetical protein